MSSPKQEVFTETEASLRERLSEIANSYTDIATQLNRQIETISAKIGEIDNSMPIFTPPKTEGKNAEVATASVVSNLLDAEANIRRRIQELDTLIDAL